MRERLRLFGATPETLTFLLADQVAKSTELAESRARLP
jgi:hypothetical protein